MFATMMRTRRDDDADHVPIIGDDARRAAGGG
jgi:hypothetical protein